MIADSLTLRRIAAVIGVAAIVQLTGCASISGARSDLQASRQIPQKPAKEKKPEESDEAAGLRLARILVSQQRLEGAAGVYAELDRKGLLTPKTMIEYAGVLAMIQPPRQTLPVFMRAEAMAQGAGETLSADEKSALYTGLGRAYMASLRLPDAKKALETALKFDDRNVSTLNAYGVLTDSMGDHKGAQASFEKALSVSPANISVLNNLALSRLASGDIRGAKKALTDARSFDSGRGAQGLSVRMNLAFTQFMDGDSTRAAETLKEIMAESQAEDTLKLFTRMKARIDAGESTLADECLRAPRDTRRVLHPLRARSHGAHSRNRGDRGERGARPVPRRRDARTRCGDEPPAGGRGLFARVPEPRECHPGDGGAVRDA